MPIGTSCRRIGGRAREALHILRASPRSGHAPPRRLGPFDEGWRSAMRTTAWTGADGAPALLNKQLGYRLLPSARLTSIYLLPGTYQPLLLGDCRLEACRTSIFLLMNLVVAKTRRRVLAMLGRGSRSPPRWIALCRPRPAWRASCDDARLRRQRLGTRRHRVRLAGAQRRGPHHPSSVAVSARPSIRADRMLAHLGSPTSAPILESG